MKYHSSNKGIEQASELLGGHCWEVMRRPGSKTRGVAPCIFQSQIHFVQRFQKT